MSEQEQNTRNFDLTSYARATDKMIIVNNNSYEGTLQSYRKVLESARPHDLRDVLETIANGNIDAKRKLSRDYYYLDGYYKEILTYYSTLLKYAGLVIPNPKGKQKLSSPDLEKRYHKAQSLIDSLNVPVALTHWMLMVLLDGAYYGLRAETEKGVCAFIDLPPRYCRSRFKDPQGFYLIEFDLTYFDTLTEGPIRDGVLATYPKFITKEYKKLKSGKSNLKTSWTIIPHEYGACFMLHDGRPYFLNVIPAILDYNAAVFDQRESSDDEVRKMIIQKIPHLTDGRLLFEPDEAAAIHQGTVGMLQNNKNLSVITTYADVEVESSRTSAENVDDLLTRIEQNIYAQAGTSGQLFASTGSAGLKESLNNDLAFVMSIAQQFEFYLTDLLNREFGNKNISFAYRLLPVSYYNTNDYADATLHLAQSGYSFLMPLASIGLHQEDILGLKALELDVMKLDKVLMPLKTSYTQSGDGESEEKTEEKPVTEKDEGGRPAMEEEDKQQTTRDQQQARDNAGGS